MKFIATLILNAIVTLLLIAFCYNYLFFPFFEKQIQLLGQALSTGHHEQFDGIPPTMIEIDKKIDDLKAELEKNIAARSKLKEVLGEARKSATNSNASQELPLTPEEIKKDYGPPSKPIILFSERTARPPTFADEKRDHENAFGKHATQQASKPNASQEQ